MCALLANDKTEKKLSVGRGAWQNISLKMLLGN